MVKFLKFMQYPAASLLLVSFFCQLLLKSKLYFTIGVLFSLWLPVGKGVSMITLWGRNNSTNVKKVLLTLEELELPYEQILAGREFGINHDADFLAMNPNGLVPLLRDDESDLILW